MLHREQGNSEAKCLLMIALHVSGGSPSLALNGLGVIKAQLVNSC